MMRAIRLGNFKAFAEVQQVPLRRITLVYGPNSAGKSSIIHSLVLAHDAILRGDLDTQRTEVGGDSIDLGGFRQYVHRRDASKRVEWVIELDTAQLSGRVGELLAPAHTVQLAMSIGMGELDEGQATLFGDLARVRGPRVGVESCVVLADDRPLVTMSARRGGLLRIDRLDQEHPVFRELLKAIVLSTTTTQNVSEEDFVGIDEAIDALVPELIVRIGHFLPQMDARLSMEQETQQTLLFPIGRGDRRDSLAQAVQMFLPRSLRDLINGISSAVESAVGRLRYLGPLRSYPPRHLAFAARNDPNWRAGGGEAWDVIARDESVRSQVNRWLSDPKRLQTPYHLEIRRLYDIEHLAEPVGSEAHAYDVKSRALLLSDMQAVLFAHEVTIETIDRIKADLLTRHQDLDLDANVTAFDGVDELEGIATRAAQGLESVPIVALVDQRSGTVVSHRDVGIGISQVLPVLVNAYSLHDQFIAIEQPEIHLHPALQAELGDVFIESALGACHNQLLLETHSEHILLRLMRRMRETAEGRVGEGHYPLRPEDVMVLFVEPDGARSIVRQMPLNERGELVKAWPGGFFEEGLREVF